MRGLRGGHAGVKRVNDIDGLHPGQGAGRAGIAWQEVWYDVTSWRRAGVDASPWRLSGRETHFRNFGKRDE